MCGPSAGQSAVSNEQQSFYSQLSQNYSTEFAGQQGILSSLTSAFSPILAAGPNQQGFSPAENAALNTQAMNQSSANYKNAATATQSAEAGRGGGNAYLPSGVNSEINQQVASGAASNLSQEELGITQANYAQGRQNFNTAAGALSGVANMENPQGGAGAATGAGNSAFSSATTEYNQGNAWMGMVGGALGGAASAVTGGLTGGLGTAVSGIGSGNFGW
jgi:hypothetical protein